jgi:hypothetical protein
VHEFSFFGSRRDSESLLAVIAETGLAFIPDIWVETPDPLVFREMDDVLKDLLQKDRSVYIWSESLGRLPRMHRADSGERRGLYRPLPYSDCAAISLFIPPFYEESGVMQLGAGRLSAPGTLMDTKTGESLPAANLVAAFSDVRALMRRVLKRHRMTRWIWIGPDGLRLVPEGKGRLTAPGLYADPVS